VRFALTYILWKTLISSRCGISNNFLNGGRREAFTDEGSDEESVLVLKAEAVDKDVNATDDVEDVVLSREGFQ